jgi:hypothetical protein
MRPSGRTSPASAAPSGSQAPSTSHLAIDSPRGPISRHSSGPVVQVRRWRYRNAPLARHPMMSPSPAVARRPAILSALRRSLRLASVPMSTPWECRARHRGRQRCWRRTLDSSRSAAPRLRPTWLKTSGNEQGKHAPAGESREMWPALRFWRPLSVPWNAGGHGVRDGGDAPPAGGRRACANGRHPPGNAPSGPSRRLERQISFARAVNGCHNYIYSHERLAKGPEVRGKC